MLKGWGWALPAKTDDNPIDVSFPIFALNKPWLWTYFFYFYYKLFLGWLFIRLFSYTLLGIVPIPKKLPGWLLFPKIKLVFFSYTPFIVYFFELSYFYSFGLEANDKL